MVDAVGASYNLAASPRRFPSRMHDLSHLPLRLRCTLVALGLAALAMGPGCVRRRLMVRSNPPGAMVYVDNQPVGSTPCATSFVYYGTREIRLVKPGYETLTVKQPIPAPWYEIPPIDFASENLVPSEINDFRTVNYTLTPSVIVPTEQLLSRAEQLRAGTQQGAVLPAGAQVAPGVTTLNPPMITSPSVAIPGPVLSAPSVAPETLAPGIMVPTLPGGGVLPPGGRPLEPLPAPQ
jgi:hypothetical protein